MNDDIDDGLTAEERAALAEDDGGVETITDAEEGAGGDDGKGTESPEDTATPGADAAAAAAAADASAAAAVPDAPAAAEIQPQQAPILVAQVPENAEARLSEIATAKEALLTKFDDGDVTAKEFQQQLDALTKQERTIERQQDRAELASQMEQQRLQNDWTATCNSFVERNAIYKDNPRLYKALDQEVRELAAKPDTAQWSGQKFLDEAHKNLKAAFGFQDSTPAPKKGEPTPRRELPPNLAKVPAADVEDTNGGRFAVLDRMSTTDPVGYEETLNKMSAADRDAYLSA